MNFGEDRGMSIDTECDMVDDRKNAFPFGIFGVSIVDTGAGHPYEVSDPAHALRSAVVMVDLIIQSEA